jgi:hypothetical protein
LSHLKLIIGGLSAGNETVVTAEPARKVAKRKPKEPVAPVSAANMQIFQEKARKLILEQVMPTTGFTVREALGEINRLCFLESKTDAEDDYRRELCYQLEDHGFHIGSLKAELGLNVCTYLAVKDAKFLIYKFPALEVYKSVIIRGLTLG